MRVLSRFRRPLVVVGIVALVGALASVAAAAVGKPVLTKAALGKLSGSVSADGSSTVGPYTTAAA